MSPLGDAVPAPLQTMLRAMGDRQGHVAAATFSDDALFAAAPSDIETGPRVEVRGCRAIEHMLLTTSSDDVWVPVLSVVDGDRCLVEGVVTAPDGAKRRTFVASVALGRGLLNRYLAYGCEGARDAIPTDIDHAPADVDEVLHRYFDSLDSGEFEAAADCFSPDVLYSHPPYRHTGLDSPDRVEFRGRAALLNAFHARGRQTFGHRILVCVQRGPHALLEGVVDDLPHGGSGSFISSLSLDGAGRIRRYVSFYCEPSVPFFTTS